MAESSAAAHSHVFLGDQHEASERRTWAVIHLCGFMMVAEIIGGLVFGSIALVADGLHMSTHAGALLLAALAYRYARRHANDDRFSFGTGKVGDLAGFTSAIILALIAVLIGYEAVSRLFDPVAIHFGEAIPIAVLGLAVNVASVWLLGGGEHHHHHGHGHGHEHGHAHHEDAHGFPTQNGEAVLEIHEDGVPPRFRLRMPQAAAAGAALPSIETERPDGSRQLFALADHGSYFESIGEIPEPHAFTARVQIGEESHRVVFEEHEHDHAAHRDNNMRAAVIHVIADAAVSVCVIVGLLLARTFGWLWMDPLAGILGACVIASWSYGLIRDTGSILLDMIPDRRLAMNIRQTIESEGDKLADLHLWRLGPGHLGAIIAVETSQPHDRDFYHDRLSRFTALSHLTVEIARNAAA